MEVFQKQELTPAMIHELVALFWEIWPPRDPALSKAQMRSDYALDRSPELDHVFLLRENDRVIGHTEVFARPVFSAGRTIRNLALAGVCVHPSFRARQLGKQLVEKAFSYVDGGGFECCLFQTQVPGFYEKLGAQQIDNPFFNSLDPRHPKPRPWWDPYVMVYPGNFPLGNSAVDLNGAGY